MQLTRIIKLTVFFAGCALLIQQTRLAAQTPDPWEDGLFDQPNAELDNAATNSTGSIFLTGSGAWEMNDAGETWSLVDSPPGSSIIGYVAVVSDSTRTYLGGEANGCWLVRSSPGGAFEDDDIWPSSTGFRASCHGLAAGPDGSVYAVGTASQKKGGPIWIVKKRTGLMNWQIVESVVGGGVARAAGIHPPTGDVFVVGGFPSKNATMNWAVHRRLANSPDTSWQVVDTFGGPGPGSQAWGVAFDSSGAIYAAGYAANSSRGIITVDWIVRRSIDGGNTWCTVDSWNSGLGTFNMARAIAVSASGTVYVAGQGQDPFTNNPRWVIRRGNPGFYPNDCAAAQDTWQLSAQIPGNSQALGLIALNHLGLPSLLAVGVVRDSDGLPHGVARILSPAP